MVRVESGKSASRRIFPFTDAKSVCKAAIFWFDRQGAAQVIGQRVILTTLFFAFAFPVSGTTVAEPPIEINKDSTGAPFRTQTYEAKQTELSLQILPIAERYRQTTKWGGSIPAFNTNLVCEIADDGTVKRATCEAESWRNREQILAMMVAHASPPSAFPKFPAIDRAALGLSPAGADPLWSKLVRFAAAPGKAPPFFRLARLTVLIDAVPLSVNLTTGPLVDMMQIDIQSGKVRGGMNYPVRAMREKRQGVQTAECQVQLDRSVICRGESFEPPENASYFAGEAENLFRGAIIKAQLKDGRSALGVRFQTKLRWALPAG